jgi:hypothetical protein
MKKLITILTFIALTNFVKAQDTLQSVCQWKNSGTFNIDTLANGRSMTYEVYLSSNKTAAKKTVSVIYDSTGKYSVTGDTTVSTLKGYTGAKWTVKAENGFVVVKITSPYMIDWTVSTLFTLPKKVL